MNLALLQMALIEMNKVEAFGPDGSHPALAIALAWSLLWGLAADES